MKVFVAGATGAVGKRLVPLLVASGYEVVGSTRSAKRETSLREVGATPALVDALDRNAVMQAVLRAEPEVVLHELTGLAGATSFKKFDDEFALTNRLRTEGTTPPCRRQRPVALVPPRERRPSSADEAGEEGRRDQPPS